jgi:hypothetical protein
MVETHAHSIAPRAPFGREGGGTVVPVFRDRVPIALALAGFVVAGIAAFALPAPPATTGPNAVQEFLDAWTRSRQGTYVVVSTFRRTFADGKEIAAPATIAQRPPDRLSFGLGEAEGRVDGQIVRCGSAPDGRYGCVTADGAGDYTASVTREVHNLSTQVTGNPPLYQVTRSGPGCFDLTQTGNYPILPYGHGARLCFDPATGAPTRTEIHRDGSTETTIATSVRAAVTDADFRIPPAAGPLPDPSG